MSVLAHWSFSPLGALAIIALIVHEIGLRRLGARQSVPRPWRRRRAWAFRGGIAVILAASNSPLAYWGMQQLPVHMVDHILLMCFAPGALVASGPIVPLCWALPVARRRRVLRWVRRSRSGARLRAVWRVATRPVVGFLALNTAMLAWHVPSAFDAAMASSALHGLAMEPSFLFAGILFWRSILPSHPYAPRARLRTQLLMVLGTNAEMLVLAMSMSIFTTHAWYTMGTTFVGTGAMAGMVMSVSPALAFSSQQLAAGVLWICGDFWALPAVVLILQRLIKRDGSLFSSLEASLSGFTPVKLPPAQPLTSPSRSAT